MLKLKHSGQQIKNDLFWRDVEKLGFHWRDVASSVFFADTGNRCNWRETAPRRTIRKYPVFLRLAKLISIGFRDKWLQEEI